MPQTIPPPVALRKTAVLISTLDPAAAEALLAKMPSQIADLVRRIVPELENVGPEECDDVIREFMLAGGQSSPSATDGVELDDSLRDKIASPNGYAERSEDRSTATTTASAPSFSFLSDATSDVVAWHLARQHPQVIAVVAAHLPPAKAADVIKHLSGKLQADVLRRVAELDTADQEIVRDIEFELESLLSDDLRIARNRQTGLTNVMTILNAAGGDKSVLLESLSEHERGLAAELRQQKGSPAVRSRSTHDRSLASKPAVTSRLQQPNLDNRSAVDRSLHSRSTEDFNAGRSLQNRPDPASAGETVPHAADAPAKTDSVTEFTFEELSALGDDDWAALIRATEPHIVLLALTGASDQLLKRITQRLAKSEAQALRNKLNHSGPLRLSDIEQAQRHIARLAGELADRGVIRIAERRGFAAAA